MTSNFCTMFDVSYALRGIAFYNSCLRHCGNNFRMWVLCLDLESEEIMRKMNFPNVEIIAVSDLDDKELLRVWPGRKMNEFAWTSKASLLLHVMDEVDQNELVAYLDADVFLFSSPEELHEGFKNFSIVVMPHRFSARDMYKAADVGLYNAGIIYFRNDDTAQRCLLRWREQCLDWCYDERGVGRIGDQKYLEEWPERYDRVLVLEHKGVDLAPWNIRNYSIRKIDGNIFVDDDPLIWYHFHPLKMYADGNGVLRGYPVSMIDRQIYPPYVKALNEAVEEVRLLYNTKFIPRANPRPSMLRLLKQRIISLFR